MAERYEIREAAIRNLQRYLRRLSYEAEWSILPIPVDGIFEGRTEEALSAFQAGAGLPVTGIADEDTYLALFNEYQRLTRKDQSVPIDFFPSIPPNYEAVEGEESSFVSLLQFMLSELTVIYDAYEPPPLSGYYDEATIEAVLRFQRIHDLPLTGRVDRLTFNRLSEEYRNYLT